MEKTLNVVGLALIVRFSIMQWGFGHEIDKKFRGLLDRIVLGRGQCHG
jgi:hypothetical protein